MRKLLFIASVVIFALAGCKNTTPPQAVGSSDTTQVRVPSSQVAYINIDSLVSQYDMYLDLRGDYEVKAKKVENELTSKGRSLEKDVRDYQDKAQKGLMTRSQMAETEEKLQKQQQTFMQHRDTAMQDLAEEEQVMLNQIHYSIVEYLKEFNKDYRYGMIISTTAAGPILNADPMLDITSVVLKGLNEQYAAEKAKEKK